jgi:ABC-type branched-subunit amino acid transport system ATPase component
MSNTILEIKNITKNFYRPVKDNKGGNGQETTNVLDNFGLEIERARLTALVGDNATGKTTLFNIISGLVKPDTGEIIFRRKNSRGGYDDVNLLHLPPHKIAGQGIGRMFQDNHIFESLTVLENMFTADLNMQGENLWDAIFTRNRNKIIEKQRKNKAEEILYHFFGTGDARKTIFDKRYHATGELSEGEKRLLGLARLYMDNYQLILLDEPTSGADPEHVVKIGEMITQLDKKECTVFMIEHDLEFVQEYAEYVVFVNDGKKQADDLPGKILNREDVRKVLSGY